MQSGITATSRTRGKADESKKLMLVTEISDHPSPSQIAMFFPGYRKFLLDNV